MNVFLPFFFFLGCAFVVALRIVWYGSVAALGSSPLHTAKVHVENLLKGAIIDRGCAISSR